MRQRGAARPRLLVIWFTLAALIAVIGYNEYRKRAQVPGAVTEVTHGADGSRMLLPAPLEEITAIEVAQGGKLHRFERDAAGLWFYHGVHAGAQPGHEHKTDTQQAGRIDKAFTALARTRMERQFALDVENAYGVTSPDMVILVYARRDAPPLAQFAVGDLAPDGLSRYVLPVGGQSVVTIAEYQITNLVDLIATLNSNTDKRG